MYKRLSCLLLLSFALLFASEVDNDLVLDLPVEQELVDVMLQVKGAPLIIKLNSITIGQLPAKYIALSTDGVFISASYNNLATAGLWHTYTAQQVTSLTQYAYGQGGFDAQDTYLGLPSQPATLFNFRTNVSKTLSCPDNYFTRTIFFKGSDMCAVCPSLQSTDFLLYDLSTQQTIGHFNTTFNATSAYTVISSDGRLCAVYNKKSTICLFNSSTLKTTTITLDKPYPSNPSLSLCTFSNNGPYLITGQDKVITVWNVNGEQLAVITLNNSGTGATVTPTGFTLPAGQNPIALPVTIGSSTLLVVIDPNSNWQPFAQLQFIDPGITQGHDFPAHISGNGHILATATNNPQDNRIDLWQIVNPQ